MKLAFPKFSFVIVLVSSALLLTGMDGLASRLDASTSGAASLDVVLVFDASDSMTYDAPVGDPMRDPGQCNPAHDCHPFEEAKQAAKGFVDRLNFPNDRVAIVTFDNGVHVALNFTDFDAQPDVNNKAAVLEAIDGLGVVSPPICDRTVSPIPEGPCRDYQRYADDDPVHGNNNGKPDEPIIDEDGDGFGDFYLGFDCPIYRATGNPDTCGTTAIGQGLRVAGDEFANQITFREDALRAVILLSDGAANAPSFVCPHTTWTTPFCRDTQLSRHCSHPGDISCTSKGGVYEEDGSEVSRYDSDDYARDMADFVSEDQGALLYTIGLGDLVRTSVPRARISNPTQKCSESPPDPMGDCYGAGEQLLRYAADVGSGNYYFAPTGDYLDEIFLDIFSQLSSQRTTLMVNKTGDSDDGSCDSDCSLREAVANVPAGGTVIFAPALAGQTIALSATIVIDKNLTIDGSNLVSHVQVSGDSDGNGMGDVSAFLIDMGKTVEIVGLDIISTYQMEAYSGGGVNNYGNLTITNCSFSANTGNQGGAIHNRGSLTVNECSFSINTAEEGGAIFNDVDSIAVIDASTFTGNTAIGQSVGSAGAIGNIGTLTLTDSDFIDNSAEYGGGALVNNYLGSATIQNCTFAGNIVLGSNFSGGNPPPGFGGAIYSGSGTLMIKDSVFSNNSAERGAAINAGINEPSTEEESIVTVKNSTFSGNNADFVAGGLHVFSGIATITNSSFINNSAESGGGIVNMAGEVDVLNSTFYNNTSSLDPGGGIINAGMGLLNIKNSTFSDNPGGGIYNSNGGQLSIHNAILANNISGADCYNEGTLTIATNNLIEVNGGGEFACGTPVLIADPLLGPLADNGGPTQTRALQPGSPAIDAGDGATCESTDQRGVPRPYGASCDIGAFELEYDLPIGTTTTVSCTNPITYGSGSTCTATVTRAFSGYTPGGSVSWTTAGSGIFSGTPCTLSDAGGSATCSVTYTPSAVGDIKHMITATYTGNTTFGGSGGSQDVIVNTKALVPGITAGNRAYDGTTSATILTRTLSGVVGADAVSLVGGTATFSDKNVGNGKIVTGSGFSLFGAQAGNYHLSPTTASTTAAITPKPVSVKADDQTKLAGEPDPAFTYTASGFVGSDSFTTVPTCSVPVPHNDPGAYNILCSGGVAGENYTVGYVNGTLTVTSSTCYSLTVGHTGQGSDPVGSPANSIGCPVGQYVTGASVNLSGAAPASGWQIGGWSGTDNDSSMTNTNTVTMPAGDHSASVNYLKITPSVSTLKSVAAQDGWMLESSENSNKGGTMNSAATTLYLGDNAQKKQYRSVLSFSTKGLPDNAVITKITLKVRKQGIAGGGNPVNLFQGIIVDVKMGYFGSAPGLQSSDFQAGANKSYGPYKLALSNGWYAINLTQAKAHINLLATNGGVTQVRLRFQLDDNNNAVANYLKLYSGNAVAASRPQLIIEYYVP